MTIDPRVYFFTWLIGIMIYMYIYIYICVYFYIHFPLKYKNIRDGNKKKRRSALISSSNFLFFIPPGSHRIFQHVKHLVCWKTTTKKKKKPFTAHLCWAFIPSAANRQKKICALLTEWVAVNGSCPRRGGRRRKHVLLNLPTSFKNGTRLSQSIYWFVSRWGLKLDFGCISFNN